MSGYYFNPENLDFFYNAVIWVPKVTTFCAKVNKQND